ncbi:MAG: Crp/Fnr family transcriptional regulator [Proteobacteria bacterium]|nr:MAG: Crp/Fnr family transcriptional regulator [Pseudomonadota bacterium]
MAHLKGKGQCSICQIRHLSIFSQLPESRLGSVSAFQPAVVTFAEGEVVYRQNDSAQNAYTLRQGLVKLIKMLPNGRTQIVRVLQRGDLFGFDGFAGERYNQTAICLTQAEICRLPLDELQSLRRAYPEVEQAMTQRWLMHLREAEDMMLELGAKKAGERLASFLIRWSRRAEANSEAVWIPLPLSRAEMGELLGLTVETVSRFLSEWKRQGYIAEQRGSIRILEENRLRDAVCNTGSC